MARSANITIIQSVNWGLDTKWQSVASGMGHAVSLLPQNTLDNTVFFPGTDILIITEGVVPYSPLQVSNIQAFIQSGGDVYLQSEFICNTFQTNLAFASIVNALGGSFSWTGTESGSGGVLAPMNVLGPISANLNAVPVLSCFWYGCKGVTACGGYVEPFLEYGGNYFGFVFCPPNSTYGKLITTSDQDWILNLSCISLTEIPLMQNIITALSDPNFSCATDPSVTLVSGVVSCSGGNKGSITASVSGGHPPYSYSWSPSGGTGAVASGLGAGNYTVTITDGWGCTAIAAAAVATPIPVAGVITTTPSSCGNVNGTAAVGASGGTPGYSYSWSNGSTASFVTALSLGTISVTVTDANGCTASLSTTLVAAPALLSTVQTTSVLCHGGSTGSASVSVSSGSPGYSYAWSSGETTSAVPQMPAGSYSVQVSDAAGCTQLHSFLIVEPQILSSVPSVSSAPCFSGSGMASVAVSGGTVPYVYAWSNGASASSTTLPAGNYSVTVTDANGCTSANSISVFQPPALTLSVSVNSATCSFSTGSASIIPAGGTSPYAYSWSNGASASSVTGLAAGNYTVTVTDANGCSGVQSISVVQPAALTASVTANTAACGYANGSAVIFPSGGTPGYSYLWSNGQIMQSATGLTAGVYSVVITDAAGCSQSAQVFISNTGSPWGYVSALNNVSCNGGQNGQASVTVSVGTPPYQYLWSNGQTAASATGLTAGNCYVTVTDSLGCIVVIDTVISQPAFLACTMSAVAATCAGSANGTAGASPSGGTVPYSYQWSNGSSSGSATGLTTGNYTVTVTDANGCTVSGSVAVQAPQPLQLSITAGTNTQCLVPNGTAACSAAGGTPGYVYSWNNGSSSSQISSLSPGSYSVAVTDQNGCTASATIAVSSTASISAAVSQAVTICEGQSTVLTASGGTGYQWMGAGTGNINSVSPSVSTHYSVVVTLGACSDTATVMVTVSPVPTAGVWSSVTISAGSTTTLSGSGGTSYLWSNGESGAVVYVTPDATTEYCVTVSDGWGCSDTACVTVYVVQHICETSGQAFLPNAFSPNGDGENDALELYYPDKECIAFFHLALYSRWGELLYESSDPYFQWDGLDAGTEENDSVIGFSMQLIFKDETRVHRKGNISLLR